MINFSLYFDSIDFYASTTA